MDYVSIIGFIAATCTTSAFLPQVIKAWKYKETKDLSLIMYITISVGFAMWLIYGILITAWPVIIANGLVLLLTFSILGLKIKYG